MSDKKTARIIQFKSSKPVATTNEANSKVVLQSGSSETLSYAALEERHGPRGAYAMLLALERMAQIEDDTGLDSGQRFKNVVVALDAPPRSIH
jgi:hypothetical protein